jgi:hypothetical protein
LEQLDGAIERAKAAILSQSSSAAPAPASQHGS